MPAQRRPRGTTLSSQPVHVTAPLVPAPATDRSPSPSLVGLLYEISRILIRFDDITQAVPSLLDIVARHIPVRTGVLIAQLDGGPVVHGWRAESTPAEHLTQAEACARDAFRRWASEGGITSAQLDRQSDPSVRLLQPDARAVGRGPAGGQGRFTVLPLMIVDQPVFGALQIEGTHPFDEAQITFLNTVVNQLSIAIDRHLAARRARGALAEARAAIRSRDQFLGFVSHDLRNMAGALNMAAALALRAAHADERAWRVRLKTIEHSTAQMGKLLDDLLDMAAAEAGELTVTPRLTAVRPLIEDAADVFRSLGENIGVRLVVDVPAGLPVVQADALRIEQQVLGNLLRNAFRFSPDGSTIMLRASVEGDAVCISVTDQGSGVPLDVQDRIFDRYFHGGMDQGSHGLGLFIARTVVEKHGGQIGVTSEPGHGATFWFTIPQGAA